jgi:hypothetical protein
MPHNKNSFGVKWLRLYLYTTRVLKFPLNTVISLHKTYYEKYITIKHLYLFTCGAHIQQHHHHLIHGAGTERDSMDAC